MADSSTLLGNIGTEATNDKPTPTPCYPVTVNTGQTLTKGTFLSPAGSKGSRVPGTALWECQDTWTRSNTRRECESRSCAHLP